MREQGQAGLKALMVLGLLVLAGSLWAAGKPGGKAEEQLEEGMVNPGYVDKPDWFKNSFLDIRDDVAEATEANKRVFLYFYQDGCPYCKKLIEDNFGNRDIVEYSRKHFDLVAINMWGDRSVVDLKGNEVTEKQFAEQLRVMYTPTILMLDEGGNVAMRINGYYHPDKFMAALEYVAKREEKKQAFREYLASKPQKKASGKLHVEPFYMKPPYDLRPQSRNSGKPLMVMFEQKQCIACDELHLDILKRDHVVEEQRKFDVVLLDMWSSDKLVTPGGKNTTTRDWARELNIQYGPSIVFFDKTGKEVFRAEAYLRAFHTQYAMNYVSTEGYVKQPSFQRWLSAKADELEAKGIHVNLME